MVKVENYSVYLLFAIIQNAIIFEIYNSLEVIPSINFNLRVNLLTLYIS